MRLRNITKICSFAKYNKLKGDFRTPLRALLASSGLLNKTWHLTTINGINFDCDRGDIPVWDEYFYERHCQVSIENDLFRIRPHDNGVPDYFIKGAQNGYTYKPTRWLASDKTPQLILDLEKCEKSYFSQHGEDGVLIELMKRIPIKHSYIVEFGAYNGICMSNSRYWISEHKWSALLIEPGKKQYKKLFNLYKDNPMVTTIRSLVTQENINSLFMGANVPRDFEILSIDIDSFDYYVWEALTDYMPKIVVIEINSSILPDKEYIAGKDEILECAGKFSPGASILSYCKLGKRKGYHLVYEEINGVNLFFVHESCIRYFDDVNISPEDVYQPPQFGVIAGGTAPNGRGSASIY